MRLKTIEKDEEEIWKENVPGWLAEMTHGKCDGDAEVAYQRVKEESWQRRAEEEMERGDTPIGGFAFYSVIDEAIKFGPSWEVLPEVRVNGQREGDPYEETKETIGNNVMKGIKRYAALN